MNTRNLIRNLFMASANTIRRIRDPRKFKSLGFLYDYLNDQENITLNARALAKRDKTINHICVPDFLYITKNSAVLVLSQTEADKMMHKGVTVLITDKDYKEYPCIICKDPTFVYAKLCRYYRDLQTRATATAITGSIGKTTAKDMVQSVYSTYYKTFYSPASLNNTTSVSYISQHLPASAEKYLQEVSESSSIGTEYLSYILHPDLVIITTIDKSHFEHFGSEEKIVENVCVITKNMSPKGKVIVNIDEFHYLDKLNGREVITVSAHDPKADYHAENIQLDEHGLTFDVVIKESNKRQSIRLNDIFAPHNVVSALYAFAAGMNEQVPIHSIAEGLANYKTKGVRQNVFHTHNGILVYADCYNAVARSMHSAIEACDSIPVKGKRIAVLGDIEEAGELSTSTHQKVITYANDSKFDILITFGSKMAEAVSQVEIRSSLQVEKFTSLSLLTERIKKIVQKDDLVLFKGSHANHLEECIQKVWPEDYKERCAPLKEEEVQFWRNSMFH